MTTDKTLSRIAECAAIFGGINLIILFCTELYVAMVWSFKTFPNNPELVIAAWSGVLFLSSAIVFVFVLWLNQKSEEEEEEEKIEDVE